MAAAALDCHLCCVHCLLRSCVSGEYKRDRAVASWIVDEQSDGLARKDGEKGVGMEGRAAARTAALRTSVRALLPRIVGAMTPG